MLFSLARDIAGTRLPPTVVSLSLGSMVDIFIVILLVGE